MRERENEAPNTERMDGPGDTARTGTDLLRIDSRPLDGRSLLLGDFRQVLRTRGRGRGCEKVVIYFVKSCRLSGVSPFRDPTLQRWGRVPDGILHPLIKEIRGGRGL
jgi:hypothetical protein